MIAKRRIIIFPPNNYFPHEADIGIIGRGQTIEEAFVSAAEAVFAIMTDLQQVEDRQCISIEFAESDIELSLVTWLNQLIAEAKHYGLVLSRFSLIKEDANWIGKAWGEPWRHNMTRGTEVKGATLTMLSVSKQNDVWEARCVVDV